MGFAEQIGNFGRNTTRVMQDIVADATVTMVNEMQTPRAKGGRLGVDTGNLRASIIAELNREPDGQPRDNSGDGERQTGDVVALLIQARPGDKLFIRWAANYAVFHNNQTGFVTVPAMMWRRYVSASVMRFNQRV